MGLGGPQGSQARSCSCARSITSHRSWRSGSAQSQATNDGQETSSKSKPSLTEEDPPPHEDENAEAHEGKTEVLSDGQVASDGNEGQDRSPIRNTLSGVSHVFGTHEETDAESDKEEKVQSAWRSGANPAPRRT